MFIHHTLSFLRSVRIIPLNNYYHTAAKLKQECLATSQLKFVHEKEKKLKLCIDNGLSEIVVKKNDWLFNFKCEYLSNGFDLLKKWNPEQMDDLFVLLQLPKSKLIYLTKKTMRESTTIPYKNRVYFFSNNFEKDPQIVCYHMMIYKFLFTRQFSMLQAIYKLLIKNEVGKEDIWKDIWVFTYSVDQIKQRIARANAANVKIKPWMIRCQNKTLERSLEIKQKNRNVLNKCSTAQYLANRLNVDEKFIRDISAKYPTMLRVSPTKLQELLDYLLNEGFTPWQILRIPRIFTHSISTLQERLTELRDLGCDPTLTTLCKNKTTYHELVDKLIMKNTNKLKET
ncbi:transcription termination factor, mitochondrial [Daktulosphaira vitifoliae]|uniref:transcription termination factor, mitochondrial n=1 Tax=Daktulosphaira vitifoliae TaxID=58002 RepID=UPI0021AAB92C|nr:transcription termination factor, mitochondrial [Daktulosphaira vitifoliae]